MEKGIRRAARGGMLGIAGLLFAAGAWAQADTARGGPAPDPEGTEALQSLEGSIESLNESYLETKATVEKLSKIKLSGYVQPQWQWAESAGVASNGPAGGSWPAGVDQRFQVRRARLKAAYATPTSRLVVQFDAIPSGLSLKDAYVTLMEPWLNTFSYTMGVFDRPFGFEISYSSSSRESPERSRVFQALFPGERDLGAKVEASPPAELGLLQHLSLKAGVFTGMGPTANEIDREQDYIGRIGFQAPFYDLNLGIDGGISMYRGTAVAAGDSVYRLAGDGLARYLVTTGARGTFHDRDVNGVDAQLYYDLPVLGGLSLRGEYLWGEIPGTRGASGPYGAATTALVEREVAGWYAMWVQNLGKKVQTVVKYDVYDPNTEVEGADVGRTGANLTSADLAFATLGLGLLYHWDGNVRLMAYYDRIRNEEADAAAAGSLAPWSEDLNDNVFTFRAQMKF